MEARKEGQRPKLVACKPALVRKEARVTMRRSDVYRGKEIITSTWIVLRSGAERTFSDQAAAERFFAQEIARGDD